jgi:ubiquinone/menaquinone biosynthesis C-methylase UbiE
MTISTYSDEEFLGKYEERARIHRLVPFGKTLELLGEIKDKSILDLGCGTGDFSEMMFSAGAKVTGVDISEKWINLCKKRYADKLGDRLNFEVGTGADLKFGDGSFDALIMIAVLLNVDTIEEVESFFKNISRVLKKGGTFIFSDLNPILIMTSEVKNRYIKLAPGFSYFEDGAQYTAGIKLKNGESIEFTNRHWTLETYSRLLEKYGFHIIMISEPTYGKDAPEELQNYPIPEYILLKCQKI